jgi:hypothetical protein
MLFEILKVRFFSISDLDYYSKSTWNYLIILQVKTD